MTDKQIGGTHYSRLTVQPWDIKIGFAIYLMGYILKYLARYKRKGGVEDLKKAAHYLEKLIEVEGRE